MAKWERRDEVASAVRAVARTRRHRRNRHAGGPSWLDVDAVAADYERADNEARFCRKEFRSDRSIYSAGPKAPEQLEALDRAADEAEDALVVTALAVVTVVEDAVSREEAHRRLVLLGCLPLVDAPAPELTADALESDDPPGQLIVALPVVSHAPPAALVPAPWGGAAA